MCLLGDFERTFFLFHGRTTTDLEPESYPHLWKKRTSNILEGSRSCIISGESETSLVIN